MHLFFPYNAHSDKDSNLVKKSLNGLELWLAVASHVANFNQSLSII